MSDERVSRSQAVLQCSPVEGERGRGQLKEQPINRKVPDILYDERSIYRQEYTNIREPFSEELPWKPDSYKPTETAARGASFYGPKYVNPYGLLRGHEPPPVYESAGAQRAKEQIAEERAREQEHGKAIPKPRVLLGQKPGENFTEYRTNYCKTVTNERESLPDVKPINKGLYKYYRNADNFSYNSQHTNKAY